MKKDKRRKKKAPARTGHTDAGVIIRTNLPDGITDFLTLVADNAPDIIINWIPGYGVNYVNLSFEEITGYKTEKIIGNSGFLGRQDLS